jgi:hypothetical protein
MQVSVVAEEKGEMTLSLDNVTVAELLRVALYEQGVTFAAWKKEHYSQPVTMIIRHSSGVSKIVKQALAQIEKDVALLIKGL